VGDGNGRKKGIKCYTEKQRDQGKEQGDGEVVGGEPGKGNRADIKASVK